MLRCASIQPPKKKAATTAKKTATKKVKKTAAPKVKKAATEKVKKTATKKAAAPKKEKVSCRPQPFVCNFNYHHESKPFQIVPSISTERCKEEACCQEGEGCCSRCQGRISILPMASS